MDEFKHKWSVDSEEALCFVSRVRFIIHEHPELPQCFMLVLRCFHMCSCQSYPAVLELCCCHSVACINISTYEAHYGVSNWSKPLKAVNILIIQKLKCAFNGEIYKRILKMSICFLLMWQNLSGNSEELHGSKVFLLSNELIHMKYL